jgi:quinol monooxygenase YgiN
MITQIHAGFKVKNYERWKEGYDDNVEQRRANGETSFQVFRNTDDPNTLTVLSTYKSAEQVQAFMNSPDLKAAMEAAGITQMGQVFYLEELDKGTH